MAFLCSEKTFNLMVQSCAKNVTKFGAKNTPKLAQKVIPKIQPNCHRNSTKTPPDGCVRNRDFVDLE